jgi:hypothetical protein
VTALRAALRLLGLARRSLSLVLILALLTTNVLAFTSTAFVGLVSMGASFVGVTTVQAARTARVARVARSLAGRTVVRARNVVRRLPAKTIPVLGSAATLTFAVMEVADACETLALAEELDPSAQEATTAEVGYLCAIGAESGADLLDLASVWSDEAQRPLAD